MHSRTTIVQEGLGSVMELDQEISSHKILCRTDDQKTLPGQPWIPLAGESLLPYLRKSFLVPELDKLAPYLRFITTRSGFHISALHHQKTRGREIVVTEHPGLHAIWYHDKIFLKPIPSYLLSQAFWEYIADADPAVWSAAAGFMRTYCHLIRFEIDYRRATSDELRLIPSVDGADGPPPTFDEFVRFAAQFQALDDEQVSPRFAYGQLRLTRLNFLAFFVSGRLTYFHVHSQYRDYLGRFVAPLISVFAVISMILDSMQVELAVQGLDTSTPWPQFVGVCRWVAVLTMVLVVVLVLVVGTFVLLLVLKDQLFALSMLRVQKREGELAEVITLGRRQWSGVVG